MVKIGHATADEKGKYSGGDAGDNNGREVRTQDWYYRPWEYVIRAKDEEIAEKIAVAMEQACANENIGYDQGGRASLYYYASKQNWDISKVDSLCECDCSSLVAVCVNAAGIPVGKDIYTGNERKALMQTNQFDLYDTEDYTKSSDKLMRGDILLYEGHHTAVVLSDGDGIVRGKWEKSGTSWLWKKPNGEYAKAEWIKHKQHWYYLDNFGIMLTGLQHINGEAYYLATNADLGDSLEGSCMHTTDRGNLAEWKI